MWGHILLQKRILSPLSLSFRSQVSIGPLRKLVLYLLNTKPEDWCLTHTQREGSPRLLEVLVLVNLYACTVFFFFKHVRHGHPYSSEIGHTRDRTQLAPCLVLQIQLSGEIDELRENSLEVIPLLPNAAQDVARTFRREIAIIEVRWEVLPGKGFKERHSMHSCGYHWNKYPSHILQW